LDAPAGFVAELSKEARAGPLGAQLERAVILLEILWNFENRVYLLYRRGHLRSEFVRLLASEACIRPCGFALANKGHDTRALQAYLGHRNIQHTVRYTELSPQRFKDIWSERCPRNRAAESTCAFSVRGLSHVATDTETHWRLALSHCGPSRRLLNDQGIPSTR
jgi:hypothetical protein